LDKFPEAFKRFEEVVDIDQIQTFSELRSSFSLWAGKNWKGSNEQITALEVEARRLGISVPFRLMREYVVPRKVHRAYSHEKVEAKTWRFEWIEVKGHPQRRYRDLKTRRFIKKPE
jgi:hypothetical protein